MNHIRDIYNLLRIKFIYLGIKLTLMRDESSQSFSIVESRTTTIEGKIHLYLFLKKYDDTSFEILQRQASSRDDYNHLSIIIFDVLEDAISSLRVQRFGCSDISIPNHRGETPQTKRNNKIKIRKWNSNENSKNSKITK